jgi:uncharacterized protein (DUF1015 family)
LPSIIPFKGIIPNPELAYSLVNGKEFNSFSIISHLFEEYFDLGSIREDALPSFYLYRIKNQNRSFTGLWVTTRKEDLENGNIRKHEKIHADRSSGVEEMFREKKIDFNPILLTYSPNSSLDQYFEEVMLGLPVFSLHEEIENQTHALWRISDPERMEWIQKTFEMLNPVYLADGHHRAQAFQNWMDHPSGKRREYEISGFSSIYFSLNEVEIKAYHRVFRLKDPKVLDEVMEIISQNFQMEKMDKLEIPKKKGEFFMINFRKEMYKMVPNSEFLQKYRVLSPNPSVLEIRNDLDVSIFQDHILSSILGLGTDQSLGELNYMGGKHSEEMIRDKVFSGEYSLGFLLAPPEFEEIRAISDAGLSMPPKSTYFEPKIPSGLIIQKLKG